MNNNKKEFILPPVGLLNLSRQRQNKNNYSKLYNTCYINASIQCLFHLEELFILY
jgi:ubiquitin C-terminal hydrolase